VTVAVGPAAARDQVTGRITAVSDTGIELAVEAPGKPGAKKRAPTTRQVPWSDLGPGRVQVEFGRAPAADEDAQEDDGHEDDGHEDDGHEDDPDDGELADDIDDDSQRRGGGQ
jgi:ribosome maturation factor RimP